jgi:hypothetical protein
MVDDWVVQKWETGTLFGNGFQGGIWQSQTDVIVGCCGTNPGQKGKFIQDILADLQIVLKMIPSQATAARKMVRIAKGMAQGRRVSITGHSLGGGLAQVAGMWESVPFVTFNAPAMRTALYASKYMGLSGVAAAIWTHAAGPIRDAAGLNFRITKDLVSMHGPAGDHVGTFVDLTNRYAHFGAHGKNTCWQAILETDWAGIDPFG